MMIDDDDDEEEDDDDNDGGDGDGHGDGHGEGDGDAGADAVADAGADAGAGDDDDNSFFVPGRVQMHQAATRSKSLIQWRCGKPFQHRRLNSLAVMTSMNFSCQIPKQTTY